MPKPIEEPKHDDMFFCCADWETYREEDPSPSDNNTAPFLNKRMSKLSAKTELWGSTAHSSVEVSSFDVDTVMKKVPSAEGERIVCQKRYQLKKRLNFQKKIEVPAFNQDSSDRQTSDNSSQSFQDVCLSPMGANHVARPTLFSSR